MRTTFLDQMFWVLVLPSTHGNPTAVTINHRHEVTVQLRDGLAAGYLPSIQMKQQMLKTVCK